MLRALTGLLAVLLVAWASPALAQGCGSSNPNCVVPTVSPPTTADNRAASTTFVQNAIGAPANVTKNPVGWVRMFQTGQSSPWVCIDPFGNSVSLVGSNSQGLQECINYANTNGYNLHVFGGQALPNGTIPYAVIVSTATINFPNSYGTTIVFDWVFLQITPANPANDGVVIDGQQISTIDFEGQLDYHGNGNAVHILPTTHNPSAQAGLLSNTITFRWIKANGTTPTLVHITPGATLIRGNVFNFPFLDGSNDLGVATSAFLFEVDTSSPSVTTGFYNNEIHIGQAVMCLTACLQLGTSSSNTVQQSFYFIGGIYPGGTSASGIVTFAQFDYIHVAVIANDIISPSQYVTGIAFSNTGSFNNNSVNYGQIYGNSSSQFTNAGAVPQTDFVTTGNLFNWMLGDSPPQAAGFNGALELGATSTNGGIHSGQGSVNDVTLQNKAFATVCAIPTGTQNWFCQSSNFSALPSSPTGNGQSGIGASATLGHVDIGQGSTNDNTVENKSAAAVCQNPTGTTTWNCGTLQQNGVGVVAIGGVLASATPGNPTGTTSTAAFVMMGLGSTCTVTPTSTGRVRFHIQGNIANNTASDSGQVQLATGTGSAPANAAAATGTVRGNPIKGVVIATANAPGAFALDAVATGLTLSTAVWFDLQAEAITGGTFSPSSITCDASEF